tara:strand:- start:986 stop:1447 length:462 start_codon:yes stop_codon:yes gene_type:complete
MSKDKLTICPRCGSDACYKQELGADYEVHQCYGCGFTTNSQMVSESQFLEEQLEILPELYKDLIFIDDKGYHWMPSAINTPEQGMVYADGKTPEEWKWSAVKAMPIPEKDRKKYPIPGKEEEYYEYKMDSSTLKQFKERDFMEALDYIGVFKQ